MGKAAYDVVVVGSGPNGLAAAITMQRAGLSVLLIEGKETIGGGMRTAELTLPGFRHDICSAVHPLAVLSPFFAALPLEKFGLEMIQPGFAAAHPFDDGSAAVLEQSLRGTARRLGADEQRYLDFMGPLVKNIPGLLDSILGPLSWPAEPFKLAGFGLKALPSAAAIAGRFTTKEACGLWAGMAAHSIQPLENWATSAFAIVLLAAGHLVGWPVPKGGSEAIANALAAYYISIGGEIQTGMQVKSLNQLPESRAVFMDVTPKQLVAIAENQLSSSYKNRLKNYRYGSGVFKIDWALSEQVPFKSAECRQAGTVHLGGTFEEISGYERKIAKGENAGKPFVLLTQPTVSDTSRAPEGKHIAWAYCHVPHGSERDMTEAIENQVERFAPGFRDVILAKNTMNTKQIEAYNPNYIGGDINGGVQDIFQLYSRPVLSISPYRTSADNIYLCSSSTPPGGGVHGMCGYHAARQALKDVFKITPAIG